MAGQCQFSCLADQLYGREISREWRADILLRRLALYVIATNEVRAALLLPVERPLCHVGLGSLGSSRRTRFVTLAPHSLTFIHALT